MYNCVWLVENKFYIPWMSLNVLTKHANFFILDFFNIIFFHELLRKKII